MISHRLPIVATLIAAGIASSLADAEAAVSLSNKNLRGIGSRRLQDGPDVIVPLLAMTLPRWSPATTCIHGFEPNPRWVKRLQNVTRHLQSRTASLTVHYAGVTHLAAGHATLTLDGGARNEGASIVARPLSAVRARPGKGGGAGGGAGGTQRATTHTVPTINLVQWLSARLDELPG